MDPFKNFNPSGKMNFEDFEKIMKKQMDSDSSDDGSEKNSIAKIDFNKLHLI